MSLFLTVLRECFEYGIVLSLLNVVFPLHRRVLIPAAVITIISSFVVTGILFPFTDITGKVYTAFMFYGFILILMSSLFAGRFVIYPILALVLSLFFPSGQLAAVVYDALELRGISVIAPVLIGVSVAVVLFVVSSRFLRRVDMTRYIQYDGVFVVLAAFCFNFGGLNEFDHSSVITSSHNALSGFFSDLVPFIRELLLLPGGDVVSNPFDSIFELISTQRFSMAVLALVLFLPPVIVFARLMLTPEPGTDGLEKKALKRKVIGSYRDELVRKGIPLLGALAISMILLHSANLAARPSYEPEPVPVVEEGDTVHIPLVDKFGDISDGKMRKYLVSYNGESYRLIVMMRPDGEVVAVLDACEVCPPRGYMQRADHVICKYCNTPIPVQSLGQPGGCNPIPLVYKVNGDILLIDKADIAKAFSEAGKETGSVLR